MNKKRSLAIAFALIGYVAIAQKTYSTAIPSPKPSAYACHFFKASQLYQPATTSDVHAYNEIEWMEGIIKSITKLTGLQNKIKLVSQPGSNNCSALCIENGIGSDRYIIFDRLFLQQYQKKTNKWFVIGVVAHELGHHLNGHTIGGFGSRPDNELEADAFAGFVMQKMGASEEEAKAIFSFLDATQGPPSHPVRAERYLGVQRGWNEAAQSVGYANLRFNEADNSQMATRIYYRALSTTNAGERLSLLKRAHQLYNGNAGINSALGLAYLELTNLDSADKYTALALKQTEHAGLLWLNRAKYYLKKGDDKNAFTCLDNAISLTSIMPEAYYLKGELLNKYNEHPAVLEHTLVAVSMNPDRELAAKLFLLRAEVSAKLKNKEAARDYYRMAKKMDPNSMAIKLLETVYEF
ncbi:MAG TPA: hypothetical protein VMR70_04060 [Flavisolibacter sp.]|nr:hypothetical protein [Flavisolibacter sp.]